MTLLHRLFRPAPDPREALRPLWHATVAAAREPDWYARCGVADTVEGRFDMITVVLALVLLRLEGDWESENAARLTELFVEDMDAQLRQSGVGDLVVGKHIGKLMATLGGRIGALREALPAGAPAVADVLKRNVNLLESSSVEPLAQAVEAFHRQLGAVPADALRAGRLRP